MVVILKLGHFWSLIDVKNVCTMEVAAFNFAKVGQIMDPMENNDDINNVIILHRAYLALLDFEI